MLPLARGGRDDTDWGSFYRLQQNKGRVCSIYGDPTGGWVEGISGNFLEIAVGMWSFYWTSFHEVLE